MMKLIPNWKQGWKFTSAQFSFLGVVLFLLDIVQQTFYLLPPSTLSKLPHASTIGVLICGATLIARFIKQKDKKDGPDQ